MSGVSRGHSHKRGGGGTRECYILEFHTSSSQLQQFVYVFYVFVFCVDGRMTYNREES